MMFSDVENWFTFHENEDQHEQQDQAMIEAWWPRLHQAIPEMGDGIELIETATPRTFYDLTRRKLGMVGALRNASAASNLPLGSNTSFSNVFMVGDSTLTGASIAGVTDAALALANQLTGQRKQ
jgi:phytoene dehydrogenase-like protein